MVYLYSVENVITLSKLIGLLFMFCPPLYFVFENSKNTRNELACPVMGTIFLVYVLHWKFGKVSPILILMCIHNH